MRTFWWMNNLLISGQIGALLSGNHQLRGFHWCKVYSCSTLILMPTTCMRIWKLTFSPVQRSMGLFQGCHSRTDMCGPFSRCQGGTASLGVIFCDFVMVTGRPSWAILVCQRYDALIKHFTIHFVVPNMDSLVSVLGATIILWWSC